MSTDYIIRKGFDIKLIGEAEKTIVDLNAKRFAIKPTDFAGCFPKMLVKEDDEVKIGSPLFFDKYRPEIKFTAPVSGKVVSLVRGAKRKLLEIIIESDGKGDSVDFGKNNVESLGREKIIETMLESGVWPMVRQRPFSVIADPKASPKAIFINGFSSAPLAPDFDLLLEGQGDEFQAGLNVLAKLTDGKVHLNIGKNTSSKILLNAKNVQVNRFKGPHPTGNTSVHINRIDPINKGEVVWYTAVQEVVSIGKLFMNGKADFKRVFAFTGSEVNNPKYYRSYLGARITNMCSGNIKSDNNRFISGNVLSGEKIYKDGFLGYYNYMATVIPEGNYSEFFGWVLPGLKKFSLSGTFLSKLNKNRKYRLDTNLHGGHRPFVMTGKYEQVFPFDIYPLQLLKAIIVEDIDLMEQLGIYEIDEEDFALCEVIDTSKTEMQQIVRNGLEMMRKEMS